MAGYKQQSASIFKKGKEKNRAPPNENTHTDLAETCSCARNQETRLYMLMLCQTVTCTYVCSWFI